MFEFFIKLTHQISAVIDCSFLIIVHIFTIEKNLNYLLNFSMLLCFSQCRRGHTYLRFHKFIICSATRTEFSMLLLIITATTFFLKMPHTYSLRTGSSAISPTSCTTSTALALILNPTTERRDLKTFLISIQIKRETSKRDRFRGKNLLPVRHC